MNSSHFGKVCLLQSAISELFAEVTDRGLITRADRRDLRSALLGNSLSEEEQRSINRLLYAVRRGRLVVRD